MSSNPLRMLAPTLRGQVRRFCIGWGWSLGAADDAADIAVEVAGSNWPIFNETTLSHVLAEACTGGDGGVCDER